MNQFERRKEHPDSIIKNDLTGLPERRGHEYNIDYYLKSEAPVSGKHTVVLLSPLLAIYALLAFIAYVLLWD